jgi:crotonobetainyl-CoA:carnitine CoA-transferase CaiB-like acyl-CoA transferase
MSALEGIRVLELTHFLAGPYAGMVLADMGADVIKVEDPRHVDEARSMGPFDRRGESLYFMALNWGKRSIAVDLSAPDGRAVVHKLVRSADVVLDNYRPGVLEKLGLDHASLIAVNPAIITCSLTGYGERGPYARYPGYDYTIQAYAGVMDLAGEPDGPPAKAGISYVDHSGGLAAALAVCAALIERGRTGTGRHIDLGLFDVQYSMLTYLASWSLNAGVTPTRQAFSAHPSLVPAQNFRTRDGYLALFVGNDPMWQRLVAAVGAEELADPRFATRDGRRAHREELLGLLGTILRGGTSAQWAELLSAAGVACAPVNDLEAAMADPHAAARDLLVEQATDGHTVRRARGPVLDYSDDQAIQSPRLGEHSGQLLRQLGYGQDDIDRLTRAGVVVQEA